VVSTAHRSKGLEWDSVMLNDDFSDITDPLLSEAARTDETNLLYVATTRARKLLVRNELLKLLCEPEESDDIAEDQLTGKGGSGNVDGIPCIDSSVLTEEEQPTE
ncbi:ATP-binding domain-containing protein, partial [Pectobacterium brasiliense]|uniref:ATP-binding domain-containing protein n=1 Tax=Pectobacterium brasiliense TaxID=180957 RepID=UPI001F0827DB